LYFRFIEHSLSFELVDTALFQKQIIMIDENVRRN